MRSLRRLTIGLAGSVLASGCFWLGDSADPVGDPGSDPSETSDPDPSEQIPPRRTEASFDEDCIPPAWNDEATADAGVPVSLALRGQQVRIDGADRGLVHVVEGPGTIVAGPAGALLAFEDVVVGTDTFDTLVLVGATIELGEGTVEIDATTRVTLGDAAIAVELVPASDDDGERPFLPDSVPVDQREALADARPMTGSTTGIEIVGYDEAFAIDGEERIDLAGSWVVSAQRMYAAVGASVLGTTAEVSFEGTVVIGAAPLEGEAIGPAGPLPALPSVIMTEAPVLRIGPNWVETLEDATTRVALDGDIALLRSGVEIRHCTADRLVMSPGETRQIPIAFRQVGDASDAVFSDFSIDVVGTHASWEGRIDAQGAVPFALSEAAQAHPETSWGQGLVSFVEAWAEATTAIARGVTCIFTLGFVCPELDGEDAPTDRVDALHVYPGWMSPGQVGWAEVELTAPPSAGLYEIEVRIDGDNYEASTMLEVDVAP